MIKGELSRLEKIAFGCLLSLGLLAFILLLGFVGIFILEVFGGIGFIIFLTLIAGIIFSFAMDD